MANEHLTVSTQTFLIHAIHEGKYELVTELLTEHFPTWRTAELFALMLSSEQRRHDSFAPPKDIIAWARAMQACLPHAEFSLFKVRLVEHLMQCTMRDNGMSDDLILVALTKVMGYGMFGGHVTVALLKSLARASHPLTDLAWFWRLRPQPEEEASFRICELSQAFKAPEERQRFNMDVLEAAIPREEYIIVAGLLGDPTYLGQFSSDAHAQAFLRLLSTESFLDALLKSKDAKWAQAFQPWLSARASQIAGGAEIPAKLAAFLCDPPTPLAEEEEKQEEGARPRGP